MLPMLGTIPYTVQHSSAMTTQTIQLSPMQYFQKQWRNYQIVRVLGRSSVLRKFCDSFWRSGRS